MPPRSLWPFVWHYVRPSMPVLVLTAIVATVYAAIEVMLFGLLGELVDFLTTADRATFWDDRAGLLLGAAVVVIVVLPALDLLGGLLINQGIMGNLPMRLRWLAHRYVLHQSVSYFQDDFAGRMATKVMQTALAVRDIVTLATEVFIYVAVYFVSALVLFADSHWLMMVPLLCWLAAYVVTMRVFLPRLQRVSKRQADARSDVTGRIVDSYSNIQTVKLFAHADREADYVRASMRPFMATVHRQFRLVTGLNITLESSNGLLLLSVAGVGLWLWTEEAVTAGALAFVVGLVLRLRGMSHWILWEVAALFEHIGTVQDGMETIAQERGLSDKPGVPPLVVSAGRIAFEGIGFHYGKSGGVLEDFSLAIQPGEKIGLVGPSGAGKSTVVNLLLRFYDPESGRVTIDGQNIGDVTQDSVRAQIGLVSQDTSLLHRSVGDNIRYGRVDATAAQVRAAVEAAKVDSFLPDLVDGQGRRGLEAHVGERGVKLSGGQRQRIAIARVILKNAPILVLDEATSALDSEVEAAIQGSLTAMMVDKTVIAIAHRLSTIAVMDRLVVMDRGHIVEQGSHDDLLAANGLYARLWTRQSGGFIDASRASAVGTVAE